MRFINSLAVRDSPVELRCRMGAKGLRTNRNETQNTHPEMWESLFNTSRPRQNGSHFGDDIFKNTFLNENVWIAIKFSLKFPKGPINNNPELVQIMAWRRPGDKPLSGLMMVSSLAHICVTRPQWVKISCQFSCCCNFSGTPLNRFIRLIYSLVIWSSSIKPNS